MSWQDRRSVCILKLLLEHFYIQNSCRCFLIKTVISIFGLFTFKIILGCFHMQSCYDEKINLTASPLTHFISLVSLDTPEISDVFRGYQKRPVAWNGWSNVTIKQRLIESNEDRERLVRYRLQISSKIQANLSKFIRLYLLRKLQNIDRQLLYCKSLIQWANLNHPINTINYNNRLPVSQTQCSYDIWE